MKRVGATAVLVILMIGDPALQGEDQREDEEEACKAVPAFVHTQMPFVLVTQRRITLRRPRRSCS